MQLEWETPDRTRWRYNCDRCGWVTEWVHQKVGPLSKAVTVTSEAAEHSCALALIEMGEQEDTR